MRLVVSIDADEEVELIARLLYACTNSGPPMPAENVEWAKVHRPALMRYLNRARFIRDGLKERGWTAPSPDPATGPPAS